MVCLISFGADDCPFEKLAEARQLLLSHARLPTHILTKDIGGRTKTVVVMGETHVKRADTQHVVNSLRDKYPLVGFENARTWKFTRQACRGIQCLAGLIFRGKSGWVATGNPAEARAFLLTAGKDVLAKQVESAWGMPLSEISTDQLRKTSFSHENGTRVTGDDLVAIFRPDESLKSERDYRIYVDLEEGHRANLVAKIQDLGFLGNIALALSGVAVKHLYPNFSGTPIIESLVLVSGVFPVELLIHTTLGGKLGKKAWFRFLTPISTNTVSSREGHMSVQIEHAFESYPDVDEMITVTGLVHISGIKNFLEKMGWREITLEQYANSSPPSR